MDKSDLIREITTRMMKGDIESCKTKVEKTTWYACFMQVAEVVNTIEKLSEAGVVELKF